MKTLWMRFLAWFRLSESAICRMSEGRGMWDDYHDQDDAVVQRPYYLALTCKRCGKRFYP